MRRSRTAALAVGVLLLVSACGSSSTDADTTATASSPTTASASPGGYTDATLAEVLTKVAINGTALEPFPVDTVRKANNASLPAVVPDSCGFAATGLLTPILAGKAAAMALTTVRINVTMVDMGSAAEAEALLAKRDFVLDSPECKRLKVDSQGQQVEATISEAEVGDAGLTSSRVLISTSADSGSTVSSASLLGRKGTVLVLVTSSVSPEVAPLERVAELLAKELAAS